MRFLQNRPRLLRSGLPRSGCIAQKGLIPSFTVCLADGADSETADSRIEAVIDEMFSYEEDCFDIVTLSGAEDTMEQMLSMMTALLTGIASIAPVVDSNH